MPQKNSQQERLGSERARALAIICLTGRPDLVVREEATDIGIDLLVSVHPEDKDGLRLFGVELRSGWAAKTAESANSGLQPTMKKMLRYGRFPFPVALFLFTMEDNRGWYTWVTEPVTVPDGIVKLQQHGEAHCRPLDERAVDGIVESVNHWYDTFFAANSEDPVSPRARKLKGAGAVKHLRSRRGDATSAGTSKSKSSRQ
jgi:hypothetical protein